MRKLILLLLLSTALKPIHAQKIELSIDNKSGVYARNKPIIAYATASGTETETVKVKAWKNNTTLILDTTVLIVDEPFRIFDQAFEEACSIIIEVSSGETVDRIGAIVDPLNLQPGSLRPTDIDEFWTEQKRQLSELKFQVKIKPLETEAEIEAFEVEINCLGPRPARGYFAKPILAQPKSLPILLFLRAAGVKGEWCRSNLNSAINYATMGNGSLSYDLNAHGMLNNQNEEYYEALENGELKQYSRQGIESRDTYYFNAMYLRMLRSIEFLTRQPEWDGKRILVIGESQGGGQALAAAGLDHRVTAVVATVPALCDLSGILQSRGSGWPKPIEIVGRNPEILNTVPYFDTAHILRGAKANLVIEIGLIDLTCPSTSIYAAINQAEGDKILLPVSYREHKRPSGPDLETWNIETRAAKDAFVENYLSETL